jgi:tetratricopeptide (TPR) repeat protein
MELLDQLLDAGLLEGAGEGWYHLHQAISDYAHLQRTEIAPLQHLIQYARQICASTNTSDMQDLDAEYPVVLAALQAATTLQQSQDFIEMVFGLLPFWRTRGFYDQADRLLQTALAIVSASGNDAMQTRLLAERSQFAVVHENWEAAQQYAQAGLEFACAAEQQGARALCLQTLGTVARQKGNLAQARIYYEEGLAIAYACVDHTSISRLLSLLGGLVCHQGEYHLSECLHQEGLALARQDGNLELICQHLAGLGMTFQMQVDYTKAEQYLQEGLALAGHLKYRTLQTWMLLNLGVTTSEQGDIVRSEVFFLEGLVLARQSDDRREIKRFLMNLGAVALEQHAYERAEEYLREGLAEEQATDVISRVVLLINLGVVQGELAKEQEAQATFEECVKLARDLGNPWLLSEALCSRGEVSLLAGQVDAAEKWFQESLTVYQDSEPAQDNVTKARFGLAKVAALLGRQEEARQMGEQCLDIFTKLHHRAADEVRAWLDELPPIAPFA